MKLTESQTRAVAHRGSSLLVSASAGSGKTEVLARRVAALVSDAQQRCEIDRLLVVTFTRAAAAELRVRTARMLREQAATTSDTGLRNHLRRQELLVDAAEIGTIDAWCQRVVREHFAEAGVDPEFTVLGEQDAALLRAEALDELLDWVHRADEAPARQARAWLARAAQPGDEFLRRMVRRLNGYREHLVNPETWFAAQRAVCAAGGATLDAAAVLAAAIARECAFQVAQLEQWLGTGAGAGAAARAAAASALRPYHDALNTWRRALADPQQLPAVAGQIAEFRIEKPPRGQAAPPEVGEVRDRWLKARLQERWAGAVPAILEQADAAAELTATLLDLEQRFHQRLGAAKRAAGTYEFADILRMTLDLLGTPGGSRDRLPTELARRLQERYEHVLVDEYQDTSPVQVMVLRLVTRAESGRTNGFLVGDVKQSIYGFRQAEPRLFAELANELATGRGAGLVQQLADNFRSHPDVLAAFNALFARLLDRTLGGTDFGPDERLHAARAELDNPTLAGLPRVQVHVIEKNRGRGAAENGAEADVDKIEREAALAAAAIHEMLAAGVAVPQRQPDDTLALRPLRLADIVILLRSAKENAGLAARVLRQQGLRCATSGREALLQSVEVQDVCTVLRLLVNRRQDVPLAAYLRGPLVGLTAGELLAIRTDTGWQGEFCDAVAEYVRTRPDDALARRLEAGLARLEAWASSAREEDVPTLVRRILADGALPLFARALRGGEQRVALLRALQNAAAGCARGSQGVADFVAWLDALGDEEIDPGAATAVDDDVVRIMTIHAAKGLEFPVVFLLGTGARWNTQSLAEAVQCDSELGCGVRFDDYPRRARVLSARHLSVQQRARHQELEEELRLLYVATTRARERLIICGHLPPESWDNCLALYGDDEVPPLIARLAAANRLEWVLMATAAGRLHEPGTGSGQTPARPHAAQSARDRRSSGSRSAERELGRYEAGPHQWPDGKSLVDVQIHAAADVAVPDPAAEAPAPREPAGALDADDQAWIARTTELLAAPIDRTLARVPAVLSVSALKELALAEPAADRPHVPQASAGDGFAAWLDAPAFVAKRTGPDARDLGTAYHRVLELADFARLGSEAEARRQLAELVAAGRLDADAAAGVAPQDLAWFAASPEGRLAGGTNVRREVPFVYALSVGSVGEAVIVRGIIDVLIDTPDGLIVLDYKTDRPRDAADRAQRVAGYSVQLQLYAQAAGAIFGRPVRAARLVFLRLRETVEVPLGLVPLEQLLAIEGRP